MMSSNSDVVEVVRAGGVGVSVGVGVGVGGTCFVGLGTIDLILEEGIFDGHTQKVQRALLFGLGTDMVGNQVPLVGIQVDGLEEQQGLLVGPVVGGVR